MLINASTAKQLSDDANSYEAYSEIADAIIDATYLGEYSCYVILSERYTNAAKETYTNLLQQLGYNVEVEAYFNIDNGGEGYYSMSIKIRWDE